MWNPISPDWGIQGPKSDATASVLLLCLPELMYPAWMRAVDRTSDDGTYRQSLSVSLTEHLYNVYKGFADYFLA
jgi:hypothetical protein